MRFSNSVPADLIPVSQEGFLYVELTVLHNFQQFLVVNNFIHIATHSAIIF
jgi:hypothetical protein